MASVVSVYYGFDGVITNQDIVEYTADEIEINGISSNRYIEISDGFTTGNYVYEYTSSNSANEIIFPLVGEKQITSFLKEEETALQIKIIVKRNHKKFKSNCITDNTCVNDIIDQQFDSGYTVRGVTLVGFDNIDDETKDLLKSSEFNISDDVIFIEEGSKPRESIYSILMLIGGVIGVFIANPIKILREI